MAAYVVPGAPADINSNTVKAPDKRRIYFHLRQILI